MSLRSATNRAARSATASRSTAAAHCGLSHLMTVPSSRSSSAPRLAIALASPTADLNSAAWPAATSWTRNRRRPENSSRSAGAVRKWRRSRDRAAAGMASVPPASLVVAEQGSAAQPSPSGGPRKSKSPPSCISAWRSGWES
eukprot:scaffold7161_cov109-Isochrysis_galbana.AAC.1